MPDLQSVFEQTLNDLETTTPCRELAEVIAEATGSKVAEIIDIYKLIEQKLPEAGVSGPPLP
jgi:hypothetical protein